MMTTKPQYGVTAPTMGMTQPNKPAVVVLLPTIKRERLS